MAESFPAAARSRSATWARSRRAFSAAAPPRAGTAGGAHLGPVDRRRVLILFERVYSYDLPLGRGRLLGGWRTNGIWMFQTGRPFTVALIPDLDHSNTGRSTLGFGANDRPDLVGSARLDRPSADRWFNTAAFALPPRGQFGSAGRNVLEGPGLGAVNLSVTKDMVTSESVTAQILAEAFNARNRTNLDLPDIFALSPTFGRILSAGPPRHLQFGVKLLF